MDILDKNKELLQQLNKSRLFYIVEYDHGCKIGVSTKLWNRLKVYIKPWCYPIKNIYIAETIDCSTPLTLENMIKKSFTPINNSKEFFSLSSKEVISFIQSNRDISFKILEK